MGKVLVIVESPTKAKTINKYLGKNYIVKSSVGHIRDLPTSNSINYKSTKANKKKEKKIDPQSLFINRMGIDPYHGWQATYEIVPGKEKGVTELKDLAKKVDHIYLATDLDREGEAIAWHLREVIGGDDNRFSRVVFNEITYSAITHAFQHPRELNIDRVNAQRARRFMDRVVGYMISPLLWKKIARGLSAGRVQSVAVRLVVEREREIKAFLSKEYWKINVNLRTEQAIPLTMCITRRHKQPFMPINYEQTQIILRQLKNAIYVVNTLTNKILTTKPRAPFTTSTLQQEASTYLGYSIKKTMTLAQKLYEAGHITYMRTDSTYISKDAVNMARIYIKKSFDIKYLPNKPNQYIKKNKAQEAHEAIRPSNVNVLAEQVINVESDTHKLYKLIWEQFVACQMTSAQYNLTTLIVTADEFQLRANGHTLLFDGWTKVIPMRYKNTQDQNLPIVKVNQVLKLVSLLPSQHFTKPPARYNEASLVKELEKRGIGRPSTYVSIVSAIQERGYIRIDNRRFYAEKLGEIVTDRLEENFCELMDYDFTAKMENALDQIANNQKEWKHVLDVFFAKFSKQLENAEKNPQEGGMRLNQIVITNINCLVCGYKMCIRTASTGVFLGCTGYTLPPKKRCKNTMNLIPELETINILDNGDAETSALRTRRRCKVCGTAMDCYLIDIQRKIHVCGNSPICEGYDIEQGIFRIKGRNGLFIECEKCSADMYLKLGRFGKYMACTNCECKNTRKILRNGDIAPPKEDPVAFYELPCKQSDSYFVLRTGVAGIFLAANTFPKSRETRAPLVSELVRFRERLPEKLRYLADAPIKDDNGNLTLMRFNRKTKQQYASSEKDDKATGWTAFYIDNKWQVMKRNTTEICKPLL